MSCWASWSLSGVRFTAAISARGVILAAAAGAAATAAVEEEEARELWSDKEAVNALFTAATQPASHPAAARYAA